MNNTNFDCSLNDTTELRKLIIENPDLPLIVFCSDECNDGDYCYEYADVYNTSITELTIYDDHWLSKDDYEDKLSDDLCDKEEYKDLSDEEYNKMIKQKIAETEFVKAIVIYVG